MEVRRSLLAITFGLGLIIEIVICQLVVNVKNKGGDVLVESIQANTTEDTVILEYPNTDGTLITQFIDFKSEAQVFRAYVAGEEERGQNQLQVLCFVGRFSKNDFISSDAMSKLRQKNPTAIRTPEEEKGPDLLVHDLQVDLSKSQMVSPHIYNICHEAKETTFFKESDLTTISRSLNKDYTTLMSGMKKVYPSKYARCHDTNDMSKPCLCHYHVCIGWYPCGLKYCRGKDSTGKVVSYRCGIKTCRRCLVFEYVSKQKQLCLWDDS